MLKEIAAMKQCDWSVNLEDEEFANDPELLFREAVKAVGMTADGNYVNLVTPAEAGHPERGFIERLRQTIEAERIRPATIVYIGECGCGGFVTRVYRREAV